MSSKKIGVKLQRSTSTDSSVYLPMISGEEIEENKRPMSAKIVTNDLCFYESAVKDSVNEMTSTLRECIPGLTIKSLSNTLTGLGLQPSEAELIDISSDATLEGEIKITNAFAYKYFREPAVKFNEFSATMFWLLDNDKDGIITLDDLKNVSILTGENDPQLINGMYSMLQNQSSGRPIDCTVFHSLLEKESFLKKNANQMTGLDKRSI